MLAPLLPPVAGAPLPGLVPALVVAPAAACVPAALAVVPALALVPAVPVGVSWLDDGGPLHAAAPAKTPRDT